MIKRQFNTAFFIAYFLTTVKTSAIIRPFLSHNLNLGQEPIFYE